MKRRTMHVYGDESGGFGGDAPYFLLGIIKTYAPHVHEAEIDRLREVHRYTRQFEYKKTDRHKSAIARAVLDYFVDCDDLEFQVLLIDSRQYDVRHHRKSYDDSGRSPGLIAYNYRYKQTILQNTSMRDDLVVVLDSRTTAKEDNLAEYLRWKVDNIKNVQLVDSAKHNLIQLADLLTGSIYGEVTNVTHPVKRDLILHLRARLGIQRLTEQPLRLAQKFRVYEWRPPRYK